MPADHGRVPGLGQERPHAVPDLGRVGLLEEHSRLAFADGVEVTAEAKRRRRLPEGGRRNDAGG